MLSTTEPSTGSTSVIVRRQRNPTRQSTPHTYSPRSTRMMRLDAKWESLLHLMRKTILLMPTDPSSEVQRVDAETAVGSAATNEWQSIDLRPSVRNIALTLDPLIHDSDLNRLVMDYLVIEGYKDAADCFSRESGLKPFVDSESILNRMIIRGAIQRGDIDDAIGRVNELDPEVSRPRRRYDTAAGTTAAEHDHREHRAHRGARVHPRPNDDNIFIHAPRLATGSSGSLCADNVTPNNNQSDSLSCMPRDAFDGHALEAVCCRRPCRLL